MKPLNPVSDAADRAAIYYPSIPWGKFTIDPWEIERIQAMAIALWSYLYFNRN